MARLLAWCTSAAVILGCSSSTEPPVGPVGVAGAPSTGGSAASSGAAGAGSPAGSAGEGAGTGGGAGTAGGGTSGGGSPAGVGGSSALEPTFATVKRVVQSSCFGAPCHDEPGNPLQMKPLDDLVATLKGHTTQDCGPALTPGSPQESAFFKLLRGTCGDTARMPLGKCFEDGDPGCVPPEDVAAIEKWIQDGAKP